MFNALDRFDNDERIDLKEFCDPQLGILHVLKDPTFNEWDHSWKNVLLHKQWSLMNRIVRWPYSADLNEAGGDREAMVATETQEILKDQNASILRHYAARFSLPLFETGSMIVLLIYTPLLFSRLLGEWGEGARDALDELDTIFLGYFTLEFLMSCLGWSINTMLVQSGWGKAELIVIVTSWCACCSLSDYSVQLPIQLPAVPAVRATHALEAISSSSPSTHTLPPHPPPFTQPPPSPLHSHHLTIPPHSTPCLPTALYPHHPPPPPHCLPPDSPPANLSQDRRHFTPYRRCRRLCR